MLADLTLVINLSAGDACYAELTVGALAKAHREQAKEIIIILDDTKAQYSGFYEHKKRYQQPEFSENLEKVAGISKYLKSLGLIDQIIYVSHYCIGKNLNKKYLNNWVKETHDFRGAPITAYLVGFEVCKTQFMVRYDGDMLLHQSTQDWVIKGIGLLQKYTDCIAVSPRSAPSVPNQQAIIEIDPTYWFSTRCTLFDRFKILTKTPFICGKYRYELSMRKWTGKTYPPALETMLFHRLKDCGMKNYYILNNNCWLLHPEKKNKLFVELLPEIISEVEKGNYPAEQANVETLKLDAWEKYLQLTEV